MSEPSARAGRAALCHARASRRLVALKAQMRPSDDGAESSKEKSAGEPCGADNMSNLLAGDIERERNRIRIQNATAEKSGGTYAVQYATPYPLLSLDPHGAIPVAQLKNLAKERDTAASEHNYEQAAVLHRMLCTLGPTAQKGGTQELLRQCMSLSDADDRAGFFLKHGALALALAMSLHSARISSKPLVCPLTGRTRCRFLRAESRRRRAALQTAANLALISDWPTRGLGCHTGPRWA